MIYVLYFSVQLVPVVEVVGYLLGSEYTLGVGEEELGEDGSELPVEEIVLLMHEAVDVADVPSGELDRVEELLLFQHDGEVLVVREGVFFGVALLDGGDLDDAKLVEELEALGIGEEVVQEGVDVLVGCFVEDFHVRVEHVDKYYFGDVREGFVAALGEGTKEHHGPFLEGQEGELVLMVAGKELQDLQDLIHVLLDKGGRVHEEVVFPLEHIHGGVAAGGGFL